MHARSVPERPAPGTGRLDPEQTRRMRPEMTNVKLTVQDARHLLTSMASVAFGVYLN